jgi:hypothetical protein
LLSQRGSEGLSLVDNAWRDYRSECWLKGRRFIQAAHPKSGEEA